MKTKPIEKISYRSALRRLGLVEAFVAFCQAQPTVTDAGLVEWTRGQPELWELAVLPKRFDKMRRVLGCPGPVGSGGGREVKRGKCFYRVQKVGARREEG